ncbi:MAG: carbohydrate ABC transporter permease [Armatimonadetes bacterium]|nr:carbohydrate ABC transporter permease [Armatimonadota bacterium]
MAAKSRQRAWPRLRVAITYTSLIITGTLFTTPFFWLLSTSFKPPERIQRWPPDILPRLSIHITQNLSKPADNDARVIIVDRLPGDICKIKPLDFSYRGPRILPIDNLQATEQTLPGLAVYNYTRGLVFIPFLRQLRNTLIICFACVIGALLSCSLVAYGLSKIEWQGRNLLFIVILSTMMLPFQVTMVPLFAVFSKLGWVDTFLPLTVPAFFGNAFYIFLLRQFFMTIPIELSEAARLDGCSEFDIYRRIILPLSKPALATVGLWTFMGAWNDFVGPLIYLVDESKYTLSLGLAMFLGQYGSEYGMLMAVSTVVTIPIIILFFFTQRTFIQGITLTGLKS